MMNSPLHRRPHKASLWWPAPITDDSTLYSPTQLHCLVISFSSCIRFKIKSWPQKGSILWSRLCILRRIQKSDTIVQICCEELTWGSKLNSGDSCKDIVLDSGWIKESKIFLQYCVGFKQKSVKLTEGESDSIECDGIPMVHHVWWEVRVRRVFMYRKSCDPIMIP